MRFTFLRRLLTDDPWLTGLVGVLLAIRILYLASIPFLVEGDGYTYYHLLQEPHSSLIHATGYCLSFWPAKVLASVLGCSTAEVLRIVQQLVSVAAVVCLYTGLRTVTWRWLAATIACAIGADTLFVAAAGTSRPEFFEADLIIVLMGLVLIALHTPDVGRKRRLQLGAGVVLGVAFVTKYNSLPCAALLLAPLFDGDLAFAARLRALVRGGATALLTVVAFILVFHLPTTGCHHLNLEHGWIHMQKLALAGIPVLPEHGLASRKFLALVHSLPPVGAGPDTWHEIDAIRAAERAPFRDRFGALLTTDDTAIVDAALEPVRSNVRPAGDYGDPQLFCCIYHHLGLLEAEALLKEVYDEGRQARPGDYWRHVGEVVADGVFYRRAYRTYLPMPAARPSFYRFADRGLFDARANVVVAVDDSVMKDVEWAVAFWLPGAEVIEHFTFLRMLPELLVWAIIGIGLCCGGLLWRRHRSDRAALAVQATSLLAMGGMIAFSALIFEFRQKELIATHPLTLVALGLGFRNIAVALRGSKSSHSA